MTRKVGESMQEWATRVGYSPPGTVCGSPLVSTPSPASPSPVGEGQRAIYDEYVKKACEWISCVAANGSMAPAACTAMGGIVSQIILAAQAPKPASGGGELERRILEIVTRGAVKGEMSDTTLGSIRHSIRELFAAEADTAKDEQK